MYVQSSFKKYIIQYLRKFKFNQQGESQVTTCRCTGTPRKVNIEVLKNVTL